jgi:hypothetical protein
MAIRKKGRARFDFNGRPFVWWIDDFEFLSIASEDTHFSVKIPVMRDPGEPDALAVIGPEFPGDPDRTTRPRWYVIPSPWTDRMGKTVENVLNWCFDQSRELNAPPEGHSAIVRGL